MNTNNLVIGQKMKYKQLCEILGEEVKEGGRNRELQQEKWLHFFCFHKEGHSIIIDEIFEEPIPIEDKRVKGNHSKFVELIEEIIKDCLYQQGTTILTSTEWFVELGMVSKKYIDLTDDAETVLHFFPKEIDHFKAESYDVMNRIFIRNLSILQKKGIIDFQKNTYIRKLDHKEYKANDEEEAYIKKTRDEVMHKIGSRTYFELAYNGKLPYFFQTVNRIFQEEKEWNSAFVKYKVKKGVNYSYEPVKDISKTKEALRWKVSISMQDSYERRYQKNQKELLEWREQVKINPVGCPKKPYELRIDYLERKTRLISYYANMVL